MDWYSIFAPSVPLIEGFVRGTVIYLAVLALIRLLGQREAGGLGVTDVLLIVLVAEAVAPGLHGDATSVADGLVMVVAILFWGVVIDGVAYRFPRIGKVLKASSRPLIRNGQLDRKVMLRELMTHEEVMSQLRLHGIEDVADVERANIEPNGMISVIRRDGAETEPVEPPSTK